MTISGSALAWVMDGVEATRRVSDAGNTTKIVVLTSFSEKERPVAMLRWTRG